MERSVKYYWGKEPVLLERKLTLSSDAAPNYKYVFGLYLWTTILKLIQHYENTPIQIYRKFHLQNLKIFR